MSPFDVKPQTFYKSTDPLDKRRYYVEKFLDNRDGERLVYYTTYLTSGEIVGGQLNIIAFANVVEPDESRQELELEPEMWDFIHI